MELVYWGVYPSVGSTITTADDVNGNLNGILNWDQLNYAGISAASFVNNAEAHAVFRENTIQNVEFNLVNMGSPCQAACGGLQTQWTFGARYFLFSDHLTFVADTVDRVFTGAAEELAYAINTNNHLIGGQFGGRARYAVTSCLMFDLGAKWDCIRTPSTITLGSEAPPATPSSTTAPSTARLFGLAAARPERRSWAS